MADRSEQMVKGLLNNGALKQEGRWVMREHSGRCFIYASDFPSCHPPNGIVATGESWAEVLALLQQRRCK